MRILLDECVPRVLCRELPEHQCTTVPQMRWRGLANGALMNHARNAGFDVLITVDKGIPKQHNVRNLPVALIVMRAYSNDLDVLMPLLPRLRDVLTTIERGHVVIIP